MSVGRNVTVSRALTKETLGHRRGGEEGAALLGAAQRVDQCLDVSLSLDVIMVALAVERQTQG